MISAVEKKKKEKENREFWRKARRVMKEGDLEEM